MCLLARGLAGVHAMMQASHSVHVYTSCRYSIGYRGTSLIRNSAALEDPTVGLCPEPYVGPRGGAFSYERGTPVTHVSHDGAGAAGDRASLSFPASGTSPLTFMATSISPVFFNAPSHSRNVADQPATSSARTHSREDPSHRVPAKSHTNH